MNREVSITIKILPNGFPCRIAWSIHAGCCEIFRKRETLQDYYLHQRDKKKTQRFCEIQHELGKHVTEIHYIATDDDIELRHGF